MLVLVVVVRVAGAEGAHLALLLPLRDHLVAPRLQRLDRRPTHHRNLRPAQDRSFYVGEGEKCRQDEFRFDENIVMNFKYQYGTLTSLVLSKYVVKAEMSTRKVSTG